ncbi:MAG TPA: type I restriction enzyme HsdR N-terminal domain-containing protein [Bacteroidetes bacterium]|nr:type I restriction enzyme HsdR N-terminal domain-containing protein [Bacteroidota bacterium]
MSKDIDILKYKDYLIIEKKEGKNFLFDSIRKKFVAFTPEEMVRQLFILYLVKEKKISKKHIAVEKQIQMSNEKYRFDILVFNKRGQPNIIVECKSHKVPISSKTAIQISKYNQFLKAPFLCLTNGAITKFYKIDFDKETIEELENI